MACVRLRVDTHVCVGTARVSRGKRHAHIQRSVERDGEREREREREKERERERERERPTGPSRCPSVPVQRQQAAERASADADTRETMDFKRYGKASKRADVSPRT
jgi:hypothetical protein